MVKTTLGAGWLLNDKLLFSDDPRKAARALYLNIKANVQSESDYFGSVGPII